MTPRQLVAAWLGAIAIVVALLLVPPGLYAPRRPVPRADVVVIGSSLMAYAVPPAGRGDTSLMGDGRSHVRLARNSISEGQTLAYLGAALETRPALVLVEANPLLFDFADQAGRRPCDGVIARGVAWLHQRQAAVIDAYQNLRGRPEQAFVAGDPGGRDAAQRIDPRVVRFLYPITPRPPCEGARLDGLAAQAKRQGTRLVLLLPPRSPYARGLIGPRVDAAITVAAERLAARLGASLLRPAGAWRDDEFIDHAHLNDRGRRHFLAALRSWWARA